MVFRLANRFTASLSMAGALASAMLFMAPANAQNSPMSLADRVARLEQQQQNQDQYRTNLLNQLQQMQSQMQNMQGQIEELQHQVQQLQDQSKAQYTDLDSRVGRLEKAGSANPAPAASSTAAAPAPAAAGTAAANAPAPAAPSAPAESAAEKSAALNAYNVAFKSLKGGDYVSSSRGFREFIQKYPNDALTPNAFYWLGESYYATTNYQVAVEAFKHLLSQYPQSDKAPDATLKLGYSQLEMKQTDAGIATLKSVVTKYPNSNAAKLAQERLRKLSQPTSR
jgi:tol-pal system protein YbgF